MDHVILSDNSREVTISLERYDELVHTEALCYTLIGAAYDGASLSWNKDRLSLDDKELETVLRVMDSERYHEYLADLQEAEDGTDND